MTSKEAHDLLDRQGKVILEYNGRKLVLTSKAAIKRFFSDRKFMEIHQRPHPDAGEDSQVF